MKPRQFILQGFRAETHTEAIRDLFVLPKLDTLVINVAFVMESGVDELAAQFDRHASKVVVYAGIRNGITSIQGLRALTRRGVEVFVVDTGIRTRIFHPKFFLARSKTRARMVIGSANLTLGGLNNNIEAGVVLDFDLRLDDESDIVMMLENDVAGLAKRFPKNVFRVASEDHLRDLLEDGLLIDEAAVPPPNPGGVVSSDRKPDSVPPITLSVKRIYRKVKRREPPKPSEALSSGANSEQSLSADLQLVWESKPLARRDLTIPTGKKTNQAGSMNLDKGLLAPDVDHRSYFRDEIFAKLSWTPGRGMVEEATANFTVILKNVSHGDFELRIAHTKGTKSRTYIQRNAMSRLRWGPVRKLIASEDFLARSVRIYSDKSDSSHFVLEID